MFNVLIKSILGEDTGLDNLGILENKVLVLETNGDLEAVDVLKACGESFTKNEINILRCSFIYLFLSIVNTEVLLISI